MASDQNDDRPRDHLDGLLTAAARAARVPHGLPAPAPGDPSDDELLRVASGTASAEERARVAAAGPYTRERLEIVKDALAETGHAPTVVERAARYVFVMAKDALDLLRAATEPLAVPAPLAVRSAAGAAASRACYYEFVQPFADVEAHLKIEHVTRANSPASIDVQVKLVGGGAGARVSLVRGGDTVDSVPVGEGGAATFSGLAQARYEIIVRRSGQDEPLGKVHLDFLAA